MPYTRQSESRLTSGAPDRRDLEASILVDEGMEDPAWDDFLRSVPQGRFQQSSLWAEVKATEGYRPVRLRLIRGGQVLGGCQLLWRRSRAGRIGYVSQGPVLTSESAESAGVVVSGICRVVRDLRLRALVAQLPDFSPALSQAMSAHGFLPNRLVDLITANLVVDVSKGLPEVEAKMRRTTRKEVRQAGERGVTIREGDATDIPLFHRLMLSTCARQKTKPNPAREESLRSFWEVFHRGDNLRLCFAEYKGETLSGLLTLRFGGRATMWKRGWTSQHSDLRPNQLLTFDALRWAGQKGCKTCDFAALARDTAEALLGGKSLSDQQKRSRHFFNLGFGGAPQLLPEGLVYVRHPVLRRLYGLYAKAGALYVRN